jgi:hypothetical protein
MQLLNGLTELIAGEIAFNPDDRLVLKTIIAGMAYLSLAFSRLVMGLHYNPGQLTIIIHHLDKPPALELLKDIRFCPKPGPIIRPGVFRQ